MGGRLQLSIGYIATGILLALACLVSSAAFAQVRCYGPVVDGWCQCNSPNQRLTYCRAPAAPSAPAPSTAPAPSPGSYGGSSGGRMSGLDKAGVALGVIGNALALFDALSGSNKPSAREPSSRVDISRAAHQAFDDGRRYFDSGQYETAEAAFNQAVELFSSIGDVSNLLISRDNAHLASDRNEDKKLQEENKRTAELSYRHATNVTNRLRELAEQHKQKDNTKTPTRVSRSNCDSYFNDIRGEFEKNAKVCGIHSIQIASFDLEINGKWIPEPPSITDGEIVALIDPADRRWSRVPSGGVKPNCQLPLKVEGQQESFTECARVYVCGSSAITYAEKLSRTSQYDGCAKASAAALAAIPIPR